MGKENVNSPGGASMHESPVAVKNGVYTGDYGNRFAVVNVNLGGYRFCLHVDHTGFYPHIKVKDQNEVLNRVVDELVDCINKGAAVLAKPPRNCDRFECAEEAWIHYCDEQGQASDRSWKALILFGKWLFATAEGGDHA